MLWELSVSEQRCRAVLEAGAGVPVTEVAERYGVSRQSVHTWLQRYRQEGIAGLEDRGHQVHNHPWRIPAGVEQAICELRQGHPKWGPRRLVFEVDRRGYGAVTRSAVYRTLVRTGLIEPVSRRRRRKDYRRWERGTAMELWQLDVTASAFLTVGTEVKIVTGIDDHSRFCVLAKAVMRATARPVCWPFVDAMRVYGIPEEVLTRQRQGVHRPVPQAGRAGGGFVRQDLPGERHHPPSHQDPLTDHHWEDRAPPPDPAARAAGCARPV
jgi:transposase